MKNKTILIAGAGGFLGRSAAEQFKKHRLLLAGKQDFSLDDETFVKKYEGAEVIMNFAGVPVIRRWSKRNKKAILQSRIATTKKLGLIISQGKPLERHYIAVSAIGIYPDEGIHTEKSTGRSNSFLRDVVDRWEGEALDLRRSDCPVCILRTGVVLGKNGGMMKKILPVFKLGLGGKIGSGKQAFSWIHIKDLSRALEFVIGRKRSGIYNLVSPGNCTNAEFTKEFAWALHRPALFFVPGWTLRIFYGRAAEILLGGPKVIPERLISEGFEFRFKDIGSALQDIVN